MDERETPNQCDSASVSGLRRRLRATPALDARLKRHWLNVLPHLHEADRRRLDQILRDAEQALREG